jgi:hypothetical protein
MNTCIVARYVGFIEKASSDKTGVWMSFSRHSPTWRVVQFFHSPSQKTTGQNYSKDQFRGEKNPRQIGEWVCIFTRQS